jgi:hypothetical protein
MTSAATIFIEIYSRGYKIEQTPKKKLESLAIFYQ